MARRTRNLKRKRRKVRRTRGGLYFMGPNKNKTDLQNEIDFNKYRDYMKNKTNTTLKYDCTKLYPGENNFSREPIPVANLQRNSFDCKRTDIETRYWDLLHKVTHPATKPVEMTDDDWNKQKAEERDAWEKVKIEEEKYHHPNGWDSNRYA